MNLTIPPSDVLPDGFSHLSNAVSNSGISIFTANKSTFTLASQPEKIADPVQKPGYGPEQSNLFNKSVSEGTISFFRGLNNDTINVPEFADNYQLSSQNAGRRIFFRTRLSKTSVELLSMTTGLCSVRVKTKQPVKQLSC